MGRRLFAVVCPADWTLFGTTNARRNDQVEAQLARLHLLLVMVGTATAVVRHASTWSRRQGVARISARALFLGVLTAGAQIDLLEAVLRLARPSGRIAAATTVS